MGKLLIFLGEKKFLKRSLALCFSFSVNPNREEKII